jgi:hypothetical protein
MYGCGLLMFDVLVGGRKLSAKNAVDETVARDFSEPVY